MMVLLTGGTGVMGRNIIRKLSELGFSIRLLALPHEQIDPSTQGLVKEVWRADVGEKEKMVGICDSVRIVLHCAAVILADDPSDYERVNIGGVQNLIDESKKSGVEQFIHISSASVVYQRPTRYSRSKQEAELRIKNSGLTYTIIRPTLIFDKHSGGSEFDIFCKLLWDWPVIPFIGNGSVLKRPVYVMDIIDGLVKTVGNRNAYNRVLNFSGKESISLMDFAKFCLVLFGKRHKIIIPIPSACFEFMAWMMKHLMKKPLVTWQMIAGFIQPADLDPSEAMELVGYNPQSLYDILPHCFPRMYQK